MIVIMWLKNNAVVFQLRHYHLTNEHLCENDVITYLLLLGGLEKDISLGKDKQGG